MPKRRTDTHHLCWPKYKWNRGTWAKKVRGLAYLHVRLPIDPTHSAIHAAIAEIPVPNEFTAKDVYHQLTSLLSKGALHDTDPPEMRLELLISLFDYEAQPTADALKKQLSVIRRYKKMPP